MDSRRHSPGRRNYSFVFSIGWRRSRQQGSWPSWEKIETQQGTWTEPRLSNSCLFPLSGTVRYRCTVTVECGAPRILKTAQSPRYVTAKVATRATNVRCNNRLITSHSNSRPNIARDDIASCWQLQESCKNKGQPIRLALPFIPPYSQALTEAARAEMPLISAARASA